MRHEFKMRGHRWRCQTDDRGRLDEVVLHVGRERVPPKRVVRGKIVRNPKADARSGLVLHLEMMSLRSYFVDVAGVAIWVTIDRDGVARISSSEDRRKDPHEISRPQLDLRDPALDRPQKRMVKQ